MANIFFDNLHLWQKQTDIDFFNHFMKTWLVFNAWMYHSTGSEQDRDNINYVKDQTNSFKSKMLSFVCGSTSEAETFRQHIGNLHLSLQNRFLYNKGEKLTFENAFIGNNPQRLHTQTFRGCIYKVEFTSTGNSNHTISVVHNTATLLNLTNSRYDLEWLESHNDFIALTDERKGYIKETYKTVNPKLYKNLLVLPEHNHIKCGSCYFLSDEELLIKGLVEMLYRLRCILFHGELVPDTDSNKIYEHSYFILKMIINKLS